MTTSFDVSKVEPLFAPWEEPTRHRARAEAGKSEVRERRRPTPIDLARNLRGEVGLWRDEAYPGVSDVTRELLFHWFEAEHEVGGQPFRYFFCQREAVETFIYLREVDPADSMAGLIAKFGWRADAERKHAEKRALGIDPAEDRWPRQCLKLATGAGKTKVMSLLVAWSYFHALKVPGSPMARNFAVIAPGLTVFERLKEDFAHGRIFREDPVIPAGWEPDWNLSVVLQEEAGGGLTDGTLYLTNIHRLYPQVKTRRKKSADDPDGIEGLGDLLGPEVSKSSALDTGRRLRERIAGHGRLMVLNDEAHHVHDPELAWSKALDSLHEAAAAKGGGVVAQVDLTATPRDAKGKTFQHVVVDTPLGEAVDAGIVKTPVIGKIKLEERPSDDAAEQYEEHLRTGYARWTRSMEEWEGSGRTPLMFVMCEDTEAADAVARRLNTDPAYKLLNGKTINLHTNLKGKFRNRVVNGQKVKIFEESDSQIKDEDLAELRKLSRELDLPKSPYRCIVSVLMLREGWDVRNVTTIVPLRPLGSSILAEQTLGRGLRRMTVTGGPAELLSVVEHESFVKLYQEELGEEGLDIEVMEPEEVPKTTVTIYPDERKDLDALDIVIPTLSPGVRQTLEFTPPEWEDVTRLSAGLTPLPLAGEVRSDSVTYEGRHLVTGELVEQMQIKLPLLKSGFGAVSFYTEECGRATGVPDAHSRIGRLVQRFMEERLFEEKVKLSDKRLVARVGDKDVREHIRAVFVPLLLEKAVRDQERLPAAEPRRVRDWRRFQVTETAKRPVMEAARTPLNLVPCDNFTERTFAEFLGQPEAVAAFVKNCGPAALRIDYRTRKGFRAHYTPDFLVRLRPAAGKQRDRYLLVETKGREGIDVPYKARAAVRWCESASGPRGHWQYVYVPEELLESNFGPDVEAFVRACEPALKSVLGEADTGQQLLPFEVPAEERDASLIAEYLPEERFAELTDGGKAALRQAAALVKFHEGNAGGGDWTFAPAFQPLFAPLEDACVRFITRRLGPRMPRGGAARNDFFDAKTVFDGKAGGGLQTTLRNLQRILVHNQRMSPFGVLEFCLRHGGESDGPGGVFAAVREEFADADRRLLPQIEYVNSFRNTFVAHPEHELKSADQAKIALRQWAAALHAVNAAR